MPKRGFSSDHCVAYSLLIHLVAILTAQWSDTRAQRQDEFLSAAPWNERHAQQELLSHADKRLAETQRILEAIENWELASPSSDTTSTRPEAEQAQTGESPPNPSQTANHEATPSDQAPGNASPTPNALAPSLAEQATSLQTQLASAQQSLAAPLSLNKRSGSPGHTPSVSDSSRPNPATLHQQTKELHRAALQAFNATSEALGSLPPDTVARVLSHSAVPHLRSSSNPQASRAFASPQLRQELETATIQPQRVFLGSATKPAWFYPDSWHSLGPFPNPRRKNKDTVYPPEHHVDLDALYPSEDRRVLSWQFQQNGHFRVVPLDMEEYAVHYAYTELRSDRDRKAWLALGSDDYLKLWLNGQPLFTSYNDYKPWGIAEAFIQVELRKGYNPILARIENTWGPGEFSILLRLED